MDNGKENGNYYLGFIVPLQYIEYGFGYVIITSLYTLYSIYLRGTIGFRVQGLVFKFRV